MANVTETPSSTIQLSTLGPTTCFISQDSLDELKLLRSQVGEIKLPIAPKSNKIKSLSLILRDDSTTLDWRLA